MNREEAKIVIGNIPIKPEVLDDCYSITEYQEAKTMAIKALEQEPILDKIRTEIERHRRKTQDIDPYDLVGDCLDIIDKYRAESEE